MRHHRVVAGLLLLSSVLTPALYATSVAADSGTRLISVGGSAALVSRPDGPDGGVQNPEFAQTPDSARGEGADMSQVQLRQGAGPSVPGQVEATTQAAGNPAASANARIKTSFNGLNHRNQRLANGGNQFSLEPPDQGLCVGNGFVVEVINDVLRVFDTSGNPLTGVIDLNTFYGYAAQFNRTTLRQGPFVTDPSCWFDAETQRFFQVVLTLEVFPDTGDFTGQNHLDLAVSRTADPRDGFKIYRFDVTDDGTNGTPNHGCPPRGRPVRAGHHEPTHPNACIGDFPHLGADKNGFYLTTNEYCLFCPPTAANPTGFHAAQLYALDKQALARADAVVALTQIDTIGMQDGKPGFTLWPATSPTAADFELGAGGTEYFTSSNAAEEVSNVPNANGTNKSDQIIVWALMNTSSLKTLTPALSLRNTTVTVDQYSVPGESNQKAGNFPLGQCINDTTTPTIFGTVGCWTAIFVREPAHNEVEGNLDSSDTRVLSTTFADGHLWGTLDTGIRVGGKTKAGILFYLISPNVEEGRVGAVLVRQGNVAVPNNNAIYGTVAATHSGKAVIGLTLVGDDHFPSAAFVSLNTRSRPANVRIIAEGVGPTDGFTEYKVFANDGVHPRPRWGDYGASVASDDNTIWLGAEFIAQTCTLAQYMSAPFGSCGGTRTTLANWATRITSIDVSSPPFGSDDDFSGRADN